METLSFVDSEEDLKLIFQHFDKDAQEGLSRWQYFYAYQAALGEAPCEEDMRCRFSEACLAATDRSTSLTSESTERVSWAEFLDEMRQRCRHPYRKSHQLRTALDAEEEHWALFDALDVDRKGYLTMQDIADGVEFLKQSKSSDDDPEVDGVLKVLATHSARLRLFQALDATLKGRIHFRDFETALFAANHSTQ